ncbi:MAG: serine/threonine-protein kinase, partial [Thermoanaerobaculia bacterium]
MPPDRIGPYRLEGRLGSGGMGVVHAAWDERLERRVAVKQIRPEVAGDPLRRERFRREARAVAKLNDPAIVQIYDLLETSEGDWLVLQYVEGPTLAQRLRHGPLSPEQVVSLARDILGALEEAHSQGFLHRDLKAENVVLTPSGRTKVLDFGLAKLYEADSQASGALTTAGGLVGTYRAMSPEQANGLELDPRSDLFSVGVLLYEAATGVSPFKAGTPVETLTRVCTHLQPPANELNPAIAEPLSALIDALLEKEPERRPRSAREALGRLSNLVAGASGSAPATRHTVVANTPPSTRPEETALELGRTLSSPSYRTDHPSRRLAVFAALSLVVLAALLFGWRARQLREPLYVAVARPELGAGGGREEVALAATALHAALLRGLSSLAGVAALSPEAGEAAPSARQLARLLAADEVLTSSLDC